MAWDETANTKTEPPARDTLLFLAALALYRRQRLLLVLDEATLVRMRATSRKKSMPVALFCAMGMRATPSTARL